MPDKEKHRQISATTGAFSAYLYAYAHEQDLFKAILNGLGGYLGGAFVASLPDKIDIPTSPNHRGIGHGVAPNALVLSQIWRPLLDLSNYLNDRADEFDKKEFLADAIVAIACRIASGFVVGMLVGYPAHLVADARTPKRLPLIC